MTADLDETPLDPAQLRLQARLRRLMLISGGTLGLGILAVLIAIVYKIATIPAATAPPVRAPGAVPRAAAPYPPWLPDQLTVKRRVSVRGTIMIAGSGSMVG